MELNPNKSKALKISLLVLAAILLLLIGASFGSHFGRNRNYDRYNGGCLGSGRFEQGDRFEGRNSGRRFRTMVPNQVRQESQVQVIQSNPVKNLSATSTPAEPSAPSAVPVTK